MFWITKILKGNLHYEKFIYKLPIYFILNNSSRQITYTLENNLINLPNMMKVLFKNTLCTHPRNNNFDEGIYTYSYDKNKSLRWRQPYTNSTSCAQCIMDVWHVALTYSSNPQSVSWMRICSFWSHPYVCYLTTLALPPLTGPPLRNPITRGRLLLWTGLEVVGTAIVNQTMAGGPCDLFSLCCSRLHFTSSPFNHDVN